MQIFPSGPVIISTGSTTYNQYATFFQHTGPASYATGGMVLDFSTTYSTLNMCKILLLKGSRGVLTATNIVYSLNTPSAGKVTLQVNKYQFSQVDSPSGNVTSQPAGVTVQAASGVTTSSESSHTHDITHNHAAQASSAATNTGAGVNSALTTLNQNPGSHTHSVDPPDFVATTGAGSSHNHADNNIYAHTHTNTYTTTNASVTEIANATNISTTVWLGLVTGVRK